MPEPYLESRILSADPVELIQIMYEYAVNGVREARAALAAGDIVTRSKAICRTIGILGELEGSLNREAAGTISQNLAALYRYMRARLTAGNLKQEDGPLAEVETLLQTLGKAWQTISRRPADLTVKEVDSAPDRVWPVTGDGRFLPDVNSAYAEHGWSA